MKNVLATCSMLIISPLALADFWGVKADAGIWRPDYSGGIASNNFNGSNIRLSELGYGSESNSFFHIAIEHPMPLIPNFRVSYTNINSEKTRNLNDFLGEENALVDLSDISTSTNIDLTHLDITAYYEILDNWINFDIGLSLRQFNGGISANVFIANEPVLDTTSRANLDDILPMVYVLAEAELPFTGWSLGIEGNFTSFEDYKINDYTLSLRYLFDSLVDVGFELGYRVLNVDINKNAFGIANIELAGPYAALAFHF